MKKVLILSYYFPPNAGAHVQRIAKFVKFLPEFGYEPVILTTGNKTGRRDDELLKDIKDINIYYSPDYGKMIPGGIKKIFSRFFQPDKLISWKITAIRKALKIIGEQKIDLILTSSPPHSMSCIASVIAERSGLPLVIDMRDEWVTFPLFGKKKYPDLNRKKYNKSLSHCKSVTTVNRTLKRRILDDLNNNNIEKPVFTVYNGFDYDDIPSGIGAVQSEKIKICYNGRFKKVSSPEFFFSFIESILTEGLLIKDDLRFICSDDMSNKKWVIKYPRTEEITEFTGYLPLKESYKIIKDCDIGLILLTDYGESSSFPLKMFDYMAQDKPIIAFVDKEDELTNVLRQYKASEIFFTNEKIDGDSMRRMTDFFKKVKNGSVSPDTELKNKFNRRMQTKNLAEILDKSMAK
ncbi:MAG: glycosyltransferase [Candidatus Delongbacteria bacterium]